MVFGEYRPFFGVRLCRSGWWSRLCVTKIYPRLGGTVHSDRPRRLPHTRHRAPLTKPQAIGLLSASGCLAPRSVSRLVNLSVYEQSYWGASDSGSSPCDVPVVGGGGGTLPLWLVLLEEPMRGLDIRGMSRAHEKADRYGEMFELNAVFENGERVPDEKRPKSFPWGCWYMPATGAEPFASL